jgi:DNA-binding MarR family transcriptional regulator
MAQEDSLHPAEGSLTAADDSAELLRLVILRLAREIRTSSVEIITPSQLAVLNTVAACGEATMGRIAEIERVQPPSVSKIVGGLERIGFVERKSDPKDRRIILVAPTPRGVAYLAEVRTAGSTWLSARFADLVDADAAAIRAALPALSCLLKNNQ